ncbi:MAG: transcription termination factor NusA [Candidatus Sumerlaeia bacterium]|nr:transcription termination factor NusA [Candidatus Sumerlaeia bacterium]
MPRPKKSDEIKPLNIKQFIRAISKEKELEPEIIKQAVESAILSAASRRASVFNDPRPDLNIDSGDMRIFVKKKIVVAVKDPRREIDILSAKAKDPSHMLNQEIEVEIDPEEFGRIAAQSVRQGILQRLRDAERLRVYDDFKGKIGQVVTGIVQRYERRDAIVALGKSECLLPGQEIPMGVRYRPGDRIRCLIIDVRKSPKGPQVILSRTRSELVRQLFAVEVPEISDGTVRIVEIAREPGMRTKIAVNSMTSDVDPVGACVGMKGARVQLIVRELDNEKVDIVPYSIMPETFIRSALNPAKIVDVKLNEIERRALVTVERDSLSKAIGKRGQNAKLAAKLTGWKIDVRAQEEDATIAQMNELALRYLEDFLSKIDGLGSFAKEAIARTSEFNSVEKLAAKQPRDLMNFTGDNEVLAKEIVDSAKEYLEAYQEMADEAVLEQDGLGDMLRNVQGLAAQLRGEKFMPTASFGPVEELSDSDLPDMLGAGGVFHADPTDLPDLPDAPDADFHTPENDRDL